MRADDGGGFATAATGMGSEGAVTLMTDVEGVMGGVAGGELLFNPSMTFDNARRSLVRSGEGDRELGVETSGDSILGVGGGVRSDPTNDKRLLDFFIAGEVRTLSVGLPTGSRASSSCFAHALARCPRSFAISCAR